MNLKIDINLPVFGKALLNRLETKQITMDEFDLECAYWLATFLDLDKDGMNELQWKPYPTEPEEVKVYYQKRAKDPKYTLPNSFWQQSYIVNWSNQSSGIAARNNSNWYWLNFLKNHIPQEDLVIHSKINETMRSFPEEDLRANIVKSYTTKHWRK